MKPLFFFFACLLLALGIVFLHIKQDGGGVPVDTSLQPMENVQSIHMPAYNEQKDQYVRKLLSEGAVQTARDSMAESAQVMYRLRFLDGELFVLHSYPKLHYRATETWDYFLTRWDGTHIVISTYSNLRENKLCPATYGAIQSYCKTTTNDTTTKRER